MPLPDGSNIAVQRTRSSDIAFFVDRVGWSADASQPSSPHQGGRPADRVGRDDDADLWEHQDIQPPETENRTEIREAPEDMTIFWVECDAHGDRYKAWRDFSREVTFENYKHCEKQGGDDLD